ncbi:hypothetical protein GA0115240_123617 [Streptomyces sp. DvalAA-14]|uniref:hypothetical protein n=1 Tax=unclassified Streptomyces TaxID=2593676 RepID=UPI00081B17D7|nr:MULTISPECIES: hypothetical protein [unclassified Streptomyces]MYS20811.1 hypothetical protein [Streptomyces sp. SID4948]SCD77772.1 hypothetical protein GA0115240_123617 [Streptomyces sp. DvalAA-14]
MLEYDVSDPSAMWRDALAEVDRAFASPPRLDRPVSGCTHCFPESELMALGEDSATVSDDLLGEFMRKEVDHWDADEYAVLWRRFLPRALRSWGPGGGSDRTTPALELGRLGSSGARLPQWPTVERLAVERAFGVLLAVGVIDGRPVGDVTDLIEGIAHATGGLERWLAHVAALRGPGLDAGVVRLVLGWAKDLLWEDLDFSWWSDGDPRVIAAWLPSQRDRAEAFAVRHPGCKTAADALIAVERLQSGEGSPWVYPYGADPRLKLAA